jgi:hypothetical protein
MALMQPCRDSTKIDSYPRFVMNNVSLNMARLLAFHTQE